MSKWFEKNIYVQDLFEKGEIISYGSFINKNQFPILPQEFNSVIRSIPNGLRTLMKAQSRQNDAIITQPIFIDGVNFINKQCSNKHIRRCIQNRNKIRPACKSYWNSKFYELNWNKIWMMPFKYCINNKIKEVHWKIIHNIYPTNSFTSKILDTDEKCTFCNTEIETLDHLFYNCVFSQELWLKLETFLSQKTSYDIKLEYKNIITYYSNKENAVEHIVNLWVLFGKFHIHRVKFLRYKPAFKALTAELKNYSQALKTINNQKAVRTLTKLEEFQMTER